MKLSDYATENGISFKIGWDGKTADLFCSTSDNESYLITKKDLEEMVFSARIKGVEKVVLYTNMGIELHSTEKPQDYGLNKIKKVSLEVIEDIILFHNNPVKWQQKQRVDRFSDLVDKEFGSGLTDEETKEKEGMEKGFSENESGFYNPIIDKLNKIVNK